MLTRRTSAFAQIARAVEERLAESEVVLAPATVDEAVNAELDGLGRRLGVSARTALNYVPDDGFVTCIADTLGEAIIDARRRRMLHSI